MKLREGSLTALVPGHGVALHAAVTSGVVGPVLAALPLPVSELQTKVVTNRFLKPGEGPRRGLLRDYKP